ncbi:DUF3696 domain-containing protein [Metabacillus fastidiosus]|uniref:DUF3696 domain-containing protein n=1 Tax=Metabacillus fastidiosus TaxID=1458 RepID=UPI002E228234|nr:DUF3696 domain-containing protein [Metabacillus fastidiosus]
MINSFEIKNFKGYEGINDFELNGITIVSGTNNSGKSSLLQAIYLITQNKTINCPVLALDEEIGLGGFSDILNKTASNYDTIELSFGMDDELIENTMFNYLHVRLAYKNAHTFEKLEVFDLGDDPVLDHMLVEYELDDERIYQLTLQLMDISSGYIYSVSGEKDKGYCYLNGITPEPILYFDNEFKTKDICSDVFDQIRKVLSEINKSNIHYIKAFRMNDFTEKNVSNHRNIGISGQYTAEIIELKWNQNMDFVDKNGIPYKFSSLFDYWVQTLLGEEYKIRSKVLDKGKFKIIIEEISSGLEFELSQVGFGISQILPILTMILTSKRNDMILIENPEVHLHPKLQALFVDLCVFALKHNRKLVIETHSEHIINRVRLNIKKDQRLLEKINILFFEKNQGSIQYTDIEISEDGKIDYWPKGFFDQSYHDLLGLISNE